MAETIGWLTDKILISELKIHHTEMQVARADVDEAHRENCRNRISVLKQQRDDLIDEMAAMLGDIRAGKVRPKVYKQFKMYNDPRFMSWKCAPNS